jgi:hypothetical protein
MKWQKNQTRSDGDLQVGRASPLPEGVATSAS